MSARATRGVRRRPAPERAPGAAAIRARGVSLRYGERTVLDAVDLDVRSGELVSLVGPNGAGKSTLVGVLTGDLAPMAGSVELHGHPLASWALRDAARERAVLTQEHRVSFPFPVGEVVRMGRAPWRSTDAEDDDDRMVAWAMRVTATSHLAEQSFGTLSGGEKGRASYARVLAQATDVLLLDEPTAALDVGHQEDVLTLARSRADEGAAVVTVLHDLSLAAAWSDRVVLLHDGRVAADGPAAEVFTSERLSHVYDYPVAVHPHPATGDLLVLPDRAAARRRRAPHDDLLLEKR